MNAATADVVRLAPALMLSDADVAVALERFAAALAATEPQP